ncbi:protein shisa-4 [Molossus molossus]|uniref:Shisa family member 4 n=1 Tax=Molossus molossus TaxID=27622 RepID=A0A7J8BNK9_MOLMO|nr:protein shisa-4 [Molossus molossus]KAF6400026.1 shisa family member 4 [Molossus molossus]
MAFPPILLMLGVPLALAGTSCLGYVDEQDSWHPGFSCQPFTFCCGTCHHRFCCRDQSLLIPEFQQKRCLGLSPKVTAGIASAVMLFVALMATAVCCFCTCCYLSRRRQQLQVPFAGQEIPMTGHIVYPYPQDPKAGPAPLPPGFMCPPSGPPQHPLYPPGIPNYSPAAPPPYNPPQPAYPGA